MLASVSVGAFFGTLFFVYLIILVLSLIAWVKILDKAGYPGWWVLVALVPFLGFVMFFVFAFSEWPVTRQLALARQRGSGGGYDIHPPGSPWSPTTPPPGGYPPTGYGPGGYPPSSTYYPPSSYPPRSSYAPPTAAPPPFAPGAPPPPAGVDTAGAQADIPGLPLTDPEGAEPDADRPRPAPRSRFLPPVPPPPPPPENYPPPPPPPFGGGTA